MRYRLLILCDAFVPPMFGTRVRNLVQNLSIDRWDIHIACEQITESDYEIPNVTMHTFQYYPKKYGIKRIIWYYMWVVDKLFQLKEKCFLHFLNTEFEKQSFDIVLASAYIFPIYSPRLFAKHKNIPLVMDIRDVFEQWGNTNYMQHSNTLFTDVYRKIANIFYNRITKERNLTLKAADAVTTISSWHKKHLSIFNANTHLIYNGYDNRLFIPIDKKSSQFTIAYTGRIYNTSLQNPILLFEALQQMPSQYEIYVDWYTDTTRKTYISDLAKHYRVEYRMRYHDYVLPNNVAELLHQSSIILVLSNKSSKHGPHGILTTKFFEALGVEKPVLCVRSDEECLAKVIKETNAGIAATSVEEVKAFIMEKYAEWQQNGFTHQKVNQTEKKKYSRQYQAKQFEQIFLSLIK